MAEQQQGGLLNFFRNPFSSIRNSVSNRISDIRDNPGQAIGRGIGSVAGGALLGPMGAAGGSALASMIMNLIGGRQGDPSELNQSLNHGIGQFNNRLQGDIWSQWQPGFTTGGQPGITSPYSPPQQQGTQNNSPLLGMLGIPGYGQSQGQQAPAQGYANGDNEYTGQAGSNFVGPGPNQNTSAFAPTSTYQGQSGASTSLASGGRTVGHATMSDIENMLNAGIGRDNRTAMMTQRREVSQMRDQMRNSGQKKQPGQTVWEFLQQQPRG